MDRYIKSIYDQAKNCGLKPYEFDKEVTKYDVFNRVNGHISGVNKWKYMFAAKKLLSEMGK